MSDYIKAFDEFDSDGDSGKREETKGVRDDIELWFALHPVGPATAERQLLNDAADEIDRLRAGIREAVVAFRYAPLHDVWWLIGEECDRNITVYEHLLCLLPEGEQAGGDDE